MKRMLTPRDSLTGSGWGGWCVGLVWPAEAAWPELVLLLS